MAWLKSESIEEFLTAKLLFLVLTICFLVGILAWKFSLEWHWIVLTELALLTLGLWFVALIKQRILRAFTRVGLYADAITQAEYHQFNTPAFSAGKVNEVHQQLACLAERMQACAHEDENSANILYQLISYLECPVVLFDQQQRLVFANAAFYLKHPNAENSEKDVFAEQLGLIKLDGVWKLPASRAKYTWQILQSDLMQDGHAYQLLLLVNQEACWAKQQQYAWQQLADSFADILVQGTTPILSLCESIKEQITSSPNTSLEMLEAVIQRMKIFESAANRYRNLDTAIELNLNWVACTDIQEHALSQSALLEVKMDENLENIWCDGEVIKTILSDLLQNSEQAEASYIKLIISKQDQYILIELTDNGSGFTDIEQVGLPFVSSNSNYAGLSLFLAKKRIEQHLGVIELHNNENEGATVMIILPYVD